MSGITTHVLDTSRGRPAGEVPVTLELESADGTWKQIGEGTTDADGRAKDLLPNGFALHGGVYRLVFDTESYFAAQNVEGRLGVNGRVINIFERQLFVFSWFH